MSKSDYLENKILDHVLRNVAYTSPTTVYVGLFTAAPSEAGGGTEVVIGSNGYTRMAATFAVASGGSTSNSVAITFPTATPGAWNTVTHFGIFDAASSGNLLRWGALVPSKTIGIGDALTIPQGNLVCTED